jgi:hypothetical protein
MTGDATSVLLGPPNVPRSMSLYRAARLVLACALDSSCADMKTGGVIMLHSPARAIAAVKFFFIFSSSEL